MIIRFQKLLTPASVTKNMILGLISITTILLDKSFGFNPFIVALLYASYIVSPFSLIIVSIVLLVSSIAIDFKYFFEILFILLIYVFLIISSKMLKKSEKNKRLFLLFSFTISLFLFYLLLDFSLESFVRLLFISLLALEMGCAYQNVLSFLFLQNQTLKDDCVIIFVSSLSILFGGISYAFIVWFYFILLLSKKVFPYSSSLGIHLISIFFFYFIAPYTMNEMILFVLPLVINSIIPSKKEYYFFTILTLIFMIFDNKFYTNIQYYLCLIGYSVSLLIQGKWLNKLRSYFTSGNNLYCNQLLLNEINAMEKYVDLLNYASTSLRNSSRKKLSQRIQILYDPLERMSNITKYRYVQKIIKTKFQVEIFTKTKSFLEDENGDCSYNFEKDGVSYFLIEDGMGHSENSSIASSSANKLFLTLFDISNQIESIVGVLNELLKERIGNETYSTFDLLKIDLVKGRYYSYQFGSYPSFIYRNDELIKISKIYPPLGIISSIDCYPEEGYIQEGDVFIQASDGFSETLDNLLKIYFSYQIEDNINKLGENLFNYLCNYGELKDDKTLTIVKIKRNNEK